MISVWGGGGSDEADWVRKESGLAGGLRLLSEAYARMEHITQGRGWCRRVGPAGRGCPEAPRLRASRLAPRSLPFNTRKPCPSLPSRPLPRLPTRPPARTRSVYERGLAYVCTDFNSHGLWDKYLAFEGEQASTLHVSSLYCRLLACPVRELDRYYTRYGRVGGGEGVRACVCVCVRVWLWLCVCACVAVAVRVWVGRRWVERAAGFNANGTRPSTRKQSR